LQTVNTTTTKLPIQTFFVPLPEAELHTQLFQKIYTSASSTIVNILSISISNDQTWIWYDHWEDGFELDVTKPAMRTTEIWGDGNAANGCAPIANCTNSLDRLMAGDTLVIQRNIVTPRVASTIMFDGGDRIQASSTVSVVKANYPLSPGSVLAGAIEIVDTAQWGLQYEAPVGIDIGTVFPAFELSVFTIMAAFNNTKVVLADKTTTKILDLGNSYTFNVRKGDRIVADKPIQVHLLTGDVNSVYETRWYAMRPIDTISNSYVNPVGDSWGRTKIIFYNPHNTTLAYNIQYIENGVKKVTTGNLVSKQATWSGVIPVGSGAWIDGNQTFIPLTVTDSEEKDGTNVTTGGTMYDWGCPLVPRNELTPEALIGLGFGCTNNNCGSKFEALVPHVFFHRFWI
jgi:hypothetical protein